MPWSLSHELPISVIAEVASTSAAVLLGFSGLMGGITHYGAVLVRLSEPDIDSTTAVGFFLGLALGAAALLLEVLS